MGVHATVCDVYASRLQGSDYYDYAVGFQDHVTEVLNAATGKVQLTPSEREERRLR